MTDEVPIEVAPIAQINLEKKKHTVSFRADEDTLAKLSNYQIKNGCGKSQAIRDAIMKLEVV